MFRSHGSPSLESLGELGVWDHLHVQMLKLLKKADALEAEIAIVDSVIVRAFGGGESTGPNPVDRRKPGSKQTLMVDRNGVPLVIHLAKANDSDQKQLVPTVLDFPRIKGKRGRPKTHPDEVYADRGYDSQHNRLLLSWLGITPRIAKRNTPHGSGLGKVRWVVERTISWLKGLRRMRVRYDRLKIIQEAWNTLAAAVICFRIAKHDAIL